MLPSEYVEQGWCKFFLAADNNGKIVNVNSENAVKWCALGAVSRFAQDDNEIYYQFVTELNNVVMMPGHHYNDSPHRTQEEVVSALREVEKNLKLVDDIETISDNDINEFMRLVKNESNNVLETAKVI